MMSQVLSFSVGGWHQQRKGSWELIGDKFDHICLSIFFSILGNYKIRKAVSGEEELAQTACIVVCKCYQIDTKLLTALQENFSRKQYREKKKNVGKFCCLEATL